jgi:2,3-bisphosphoglycerate-independent phosphoglycerate mutase
MYKRLMIILDGLGDCKSPALGGRTPLEAARTPNLDRLVELGRCGLVDPIGPGVRVGTHVGAGVLMGLAPDDALQLGRGPVEAAGIDLPLGEGDVALRCNLATLVEHDGVLYVHDRRAGRVSDESAGLLADLEDLDLGDGIRATVRPATQHRAVLRLSGEGLSAAVTNTDPGDAAKLPARVQPCRPASPQDPSAQRTAAAVSRLVHMVFDRLKEHPLNRLRLARSEPPATGLITRSAGSVRSLSNNLRERGLRVAVVSAESTVIGLGRLFGFTLLNDARFTAMTDTDLHAKLRVAKGALAEHDLVFLHVKGTDVCAHDREPRAKRDFIERIDAALAGLVEEGIVVAVTADHSTDSNTGSHTGDPVPSVLYAPGGACDDRDTFGEADCRGGGLGRLSAEQFLEEFLAAPAERAVQEDTRSTQIPSA